jgi:tetratricopeptide (TPR) repeat protein
VNEHPTAAELDAFLEKSLSPERRREVLAHLLRGCESCQGAAGMTLGMTPVDLDSYDAVIKRVFRKVQRSVNREEEKARKAVALIEMGDSKSFPRNFRGLYLYQELLNRSWALRHENPAKMVALARHATLVARTFGAEIYGAEFVADWQCRAWMELGNAYRVAEDLNAAEQAFRNAEELFGKGSQDELLHARLLNFRASYFGDCREFDLALGALDTVGEIYRRSGDQHLAARASILQGVYAGYGNDTADAIRLTQEGLAQLDKARDPELFFQAVHNLGCWLVQANRYEEARKVLSRNRWRQHEAGGRLNLLKLRWLEAQINVGLQQFERAERGFLDVKQGFLDVEKPYDAAVASLDLATLWLQQGRTADAKVAALEAYDIFRSLGIRREGTGAFLILMKAFQVGKATVRLVKSVAEHLRKAQSDPAARFEPPGE